MKVYTEKEAKDLNRKEQEIVLTERNIDFSGKDRESALINKILDSNPDPNVGIKCGGRQGKYCDVIMRQVGSGPSGSDYVCDVCGNKTTIDGG